MNLHYSSAPLVMLLRFLVILLIPYMLHAVDCTGCEEQIIGTRCSYWCCQQCMNMPDVQCGYCAPPPPPAPSCYSNYNCGAGHYCCGSGLGSCCSCPEGQYSGAGAQHTCSRCPPGTFSNVPEATSIDVCQPCPAGSVSTGGASECTPCDPGTIAASTRLSKCTPCAKWSNINGVLLPGTYQPDRGKSECLICPDGTFAPEDGTANCEVVPTSQPTAIPTSRPSGQPSSLPSQQPSRQPTSRPSGQPSSVPSRQPTSVPSSRPTASPTFFPYSVRTWSGGTNTSRGDINDLEAVKYVVSHTFTRIGHDFSGRKRWYLSVNVLQSGFGYPYHQYISAKVGYALEPDGDGDGDGTWKTVVQQCSPGGNTCSLDYMNCAQNIDVTDVVAPEIGGSVTIIVTSHLVPFISRECLEITGGVVIGAQFVLSEGDPQPTYSPTFSPTPFSLGTKGVLNGKLIKLGGPLYVTFALAIVAIIFTVHIVEYQEREGKGLLHIHNLFAACQFSVTTIIGVVSDAFLLYFLLSASDTRHLATAMMFLYVLHFCSTTLVACMLFLRSGASSSSPSESKFFDLVGLSRFFPIMSDHFSTEHFLNHKILYVTLIACSFVQAPLLSLLPWTASSFATYSGGYPNMSIFRLCEYPALFQNVGDAVILTVYISNYVNAFGSEIPKVSLAFLYFTVIRHFFAVVVNLSKTMLRASMLQKLISDESVHIQSVEEKIAQKLTLEDLDCWVEAEAHYKITSNYAALELRLVELLKMAYRRYIEELKQEHEDVGGGVADEEVEDGVYRGSLESIPQDRPLLSRAQELHALNSINDEELDIYFRLTFSEMVWNIDDDINNVISNKVVGSSNSGGLDNEPEPGRQVTKNVMWQQRDGQRHSKDNDDDNDDDCMGDMGGGIKMTSTKRFMRSQRNERGGGDGGKTQNAKSELTVEKLINRHKIAQSIRQRIESLLMATKRK